MPIRVEMKTSRGAILIDLDDQKAPVSTANFLSYVDAGHYDGTIFHRVIETFMIQGGGFTNEMSQKKASKPIVKEWTNGLK
ncbi:MAG TPA: peptidylprolyl isomerase, partial [Phycisphaerales bacterium]|nr:peptidylprolyl isomerase [Phycisphaerales bacterium]